MIYQSDAITLSRHEGGFSSCSSTCRASPSTSSTAPPSRASPRHWMRWSGKRCRGLLVTSGKGVFIVGADITEFTQLFGATAEDIKGFSRPQQQQLQPPAEPAVPHRRRDQRLCHGRRPGNLPRLRPPRHEHGGEDRPAGNQARHPAGLGRHRTPAAHHRCRRGGDVDRHGEGAERRGGAQGRRRRRDRRSRNSCATSRAARCSRRSTASWIIEAPPRAKSSPLPLNDTEAMMAFFTIKAMVGQQAGQELPGAGQGRRRHRGRPRHGPRRRARRSRPQALRSWPHGRGRGPGRRVPQRPAAVKKAKGWEKKAATASSAPRCSAPASWAAASPTRAPSRACRSR
jgi:3-hydroxyacyl-CoA dehydrogenase/enoyl-CoA hydratase/3-hydroxybutyryl-CoA epimerase/enoyl-CoA isomerase